MILKTKSEIIKRIVYLLCFTDRCCLESSEINGVSYTLKQREEQRQAILDWTKRKDYYKSFSNKEKQIMETPIRKEANNDILFLYNDYECIEPLQWSIGLANKLTDYDRYVTKDLHLPLRIGPDHTTEQILSFCKDIPESEIIKYREIAMLWYWRCIVARTEKVKTPQIKNSIRDIYGEEAMNFLNRYKGFDMDKGDFTVRGKLISDISAIELQRLEIIAERRFHAFEWLFSFEDWEYVDLIC
ncbi:MAG: DUF4272 domain-containing protein [Lachnospiraceae bacterium]|nr:DUF4272 domain-containing protein [Lachnospiraceae bacterium]